MGVSAGNDEGQHRKLQIVVSFLPLFEQHGMDVAFEMVDGDQRLVEGEGQSLGIADAHQQGSRKAGALRDCDSVDGVVSMLGLGQRLAHDRHDGAQMLPRRQFRYDAAIGLVSRDLRRDDVRDQLLARAHHSRCGFVAGTFDAEDVGVGHGIHQFTVPDEIDSADCCYSSLISSTWKSNLPARRASDEKNGGDVVPVGSVEGREGNAGLLPIRPGGERLLRGDAASAGGEDKNAVGLAVALGEERDAFLRRQIDRNKRLGAGRPHHAGPRVGKAAVDHAGNVEGVLVAVGAAVDYFHFSRGFAAGDAVGRKHPSRAELGGGSAVVEVADQSDRRIRGGAAWAAFAASCLAFSRDAR